MHDLLIPPLDIPLADADRVILGKVCDAATGELGSSPECYTTKRLTFAVYVPTRLQQEKWNPNLLVKPSFSIIQIFASFVRNCSFLVNNPKFDLVMTCCPH